MYELRAWVIFHNGGGAGVKAPGWKNWEAACARRRGRTMEDAGQRGKQITVGLRFGGEMPQNLYIN